MSDSQSAAQDSQAADITSTAVIESDAGKDTTGKPAGNDGRTFTQSELDRMVEQRIARERAKFADYDQIKADAAELAKIRDAEKTELQKAMERADAAEKRASAAEFAALRSKVAASKGVPATSLTGSTEDELSASADELIAWRDQQKNTQAPAVKRNPASATGGLKSGATGTENITHDPKVRAAELLQNLRKRG